MTLFKTVFFSPLKEDVVTELGLCITRCYSFPACGEGWVGMKK